MSDLWKISLTAIAATLFVDLLDLAFARILFFVVTFRFLLYFVLHLVVSGLACFLLHTSVTQWYLLGLLGTLLGVGVFSNSDVKIGGANLLPLATLFQDIKAKMTAQAAEEKSNKILRADLADQLRSLQASDLERLCRSALTGVGWNVTRIQKACAKAASSGDTSLALAQLMIDNNLDYVIKNIGSWHNAVPRPTVVPVPPTNSGVAP